jgi:hypothetical protein
VGALVAVGALVDLTVGALVDLGPLVDLRSRPPSWTVTAVRTRRAFGVGALVAVGALVDLTVGALVDLGPLVDLRSIRPATGSCPTAAILRVGLLFSKARVDELMQMTNARII